MTLPIASTDPTWAGDDVSITFVGVVDAEGMAGLTVWVQILTIQLKKGALSIPQGKQSRVK